MQPHICPKPFRRRYPLPQGGNASHRANAGEALEFSRFRVLLRRRQLLADGVPVELGTRAFDLLLVLLEADGSLVTKEELLSRVWSGIVVSEENLKFQVSALRKALGADRDVIHTEFGRGYRFTGALRLDAAGDPGGRPMRSSARSGCFSTQSCRQLLWSVSVRQEVSNFSSQAPRAAHAQQSVRIFQAYPARGQRLAKRRCLNSRTLPVEENHQPQIDLLFREKERKRDKTSSFTGN